MKQAKIHPMTPNRLAEFRHALRDLSDRLRLDVSSVAGAAMSPTGGQADGGLSNAPMHIADVGTDTYLQELSATLLENEEFLANEVRGALRRIEEGTFGRCEACCQSIPRARLEAIPFTRYCAGCASSASGPAVNLNAGRPRGAIEHGRSDAGRRGATKEGGAIRGTQDGTRAGARKSARTKILGRRLQG